MRTFETLLPETSPTAVALGYFDGVHRGHRRVLGGAARERENGLLPVCLTFAESPKSVIAGAENRALKHLTAREFFEKILVDTLRAGALFCGFNYRFGKHAAGDTALLQTLCDEFGVALTVAPPEKDGEDVVCSTLIKRLIAEGNVRRANELLCGRFGVREVIRHGRHLGHELGAPTINQPLTKGLVVPKFGVYASEVTLESGERYGGVTNIGVKPTVGGTTPLWETWMPAYRGGEIYGETADVRLLDFIRPEKKFGSLDALKDEILRNGEQALAIYEQS